MRPRAGNRDAIPRRERGRERRLPQLRARSQRVMSKATKVASCAGLIVRTRWPGSMGGRDASGRVRRKPTVHRSQSAPIGRIAVAKLLRPMFC